MRLLPLALMLACDKSPEDTGHAGSGAGTLALSFAIHEDWHAALDEPGVGPFWGSFYYSEEVSSFGPDDGAEDLGSIYVDEVDLVDGSATATLFTSEPLPADWITVLGFVDTDGNADAESPDPDSGDPVTVPYENEFLVAEDTETEAQVFFGLLNP